MKFAVIFVTSVFALSHSQGKTWLKADGQSDNTYSLINSVLGGHRGLAYEVPDCSHSEFGPHITQIWDNQLNKSVFAFHLHKEVDNDRCVKFDRQRVEIKPSPYRSPKSLKGYENDTVTFSWDFKFDKEFQPSPKFTTLHQIKAKGGDDALPLITIALMMKYDSSKVLEVVYVGRDGISETLKSEDLSKFAGNWVLAKEELKFSRNGKFSLELTRIDGQRLMTVANDNIDLWRDGTEFIRPKWGIYRSLKNSSDLRDENVYYDNFCLGKGTADKCT